MTRREFVAGAAAAAGASVNALRADPLGLPIGCQTYPVRQALGQNFEGTLHDLAAIGYKTIEMCSPPGYARAGYGPLADMKASEMRAKIEAAGLKCESCHYQFKELKENLDERIAFARELGLTQMILSTFGLRQDAPMADWMEAAQELNRIGERVRKAGMQLGFHNHNFEFRLIDGVLVYDKLMSAYDPQLVKMQFQVSVISLGFEAATFLEKYPGRFISLHLQDWSATEKKEVPIGQGVVVWKKLFAAAKGAQVKNYFVEMNIEAMKASYPFLHGLQV
jgi:sugar phosphate isomerase/epimerase